MHSELKAQVAFHLTGRHAAAGLEAVEPLRLHPAVLAPYRDLVNLRYDFPLVFAQPPAARRVASLTTLVNELLCALAPQGAEGERLRRHLIRLEREIRILLAGGARGTLSSLWSAAARRLATAEPAIALSAERAAALLPFDGPVADCDAALPGLLLHQHWLQAQETRTAAFRKTVNRLAQKLDDILRADHVHSPAGRNADSLRAAVGPRHADSFDFAALSQLLGEALPRRALPPARKARLEWALNTLRTQRFHELPERARERRGAARVHHFIFDSCAGALKAYRERLPELVEVAKALALAELEVEGLYDDAQHAAFFSDYGAERLEADVLALFPDYLVRLRGDRLSPAEHERLNDILAAPLPMKILVQCDDLLDVAAVTGARPAFSLRDLQYAHYAMACNQAYVVQAPASHLHACRDRLDAAMAYAGPALFSVYSGLGGGGSLPAYLNAAAAHAARAFPAWAYDPAAGDDLAARFDLAGNPDAERDWPLLPLSVEDDALQRVVEDVAFTFIDFVACDPRYTQHFARVPRAQWNEAMAPADIAIACSGRPAAASVPYLPVTDDACRLHRVIADDTLVREARRCREAWHALQELGGIHNSHAARLLARERAAWAARETPAPAPAAPAVTPATPVPEAISDAARSDQAYIETARCSSCNECIQINPRLFAYDANQQAYIKDLAAGTYRELVAAAESCQVSVIHPGKPRDPGEPGLDELLQRAQPFL